MAEKQVTGGGAAPMCPNGGRFFGSAATKNFCSKCYHDHVTKIADTAAAVAPVAEKKIEAAPALAPAAKETTHTASAAAEKIAVALAPEQQPTTKPQILAATSSAPAAKAAPSRCASCNKKVGLQGFTCRCGGTFCSLHRYAEKHGCDFDFKAAAREQIPKKNPLIVAPKINKI